MKLTFNGYAIAACFITALLAISLARGADAAEPGVAAAILLLALFGLGWGAGALAARREITRLTEANWSMHIQANYDADERKCLQSLVSALKPQRSELINQ